MIVERVALENFGPFLSCRASLEAAPAACVPPDGSPEGSACPSPDAASAGSAWLVAGGSRQEQSGFLDGLARLLSCFVQAMRRSRRAGVLAGVPFPVPSPSAGAPQAVPGSLVPDLPAVPSPAASLACTVRSGRSSFSWRLAKAGEGARTRRASALGDARFLAGLYLQRRIRDHGCSLPLVACYPRDRRLFAGTGPGSRADSCFDAYDAGFGAKARLCRFLALACVACAGSGSPVSASTASGSAPGTALGCAVPPERLKACILAALQPLFPDCTDLALQGGPRPRLLLERVGGVRDLAFLPRGDALLGALAADLACRLALLNPALANPLEGDGIVLIDGLDQGLPGACGPALPESARPESAQPASALSGQARAGAVRPGPSLSLAGAVQGLRTAFPRCQFVFTAGDALSGPAGAGQGLALAEACGARLCRLELHRRPASGGA